MCSFHNTWRGGADLIGYFISVQPILYPRELVQFLRFSSFDGSFLVKFKFCAIWLIAPNLCANDKADERVTKRAFIYATAADIVKIPNFLEKQGRE